MEQHEGDCEVLDVSDEEFNLDCDLADVNLSPKQKRLLLKEKERRKKERKRKKEQSLLETYCSKFDDIRYQSKFAVNGKKTKNELPFYHHMENVVAAGLKTKMVDVSVAQCPVKNEVKRLSERGWPEEEICNWLEKASESLRMQKQPSIKKFFKPKEVKENVRCECDQEPDKCEVLTEKLISARKTNSPESLCNLANYLKVENSEIFEKKLKKEDPINLLCHGLADELITLENTEKSTYQIWQWKESKCGEAKKALIEEKVKLKENLEVLAHIFVRTELLEQGTSFLSNITLATELSGMFKETNSAVIQRLNTTRKKLRSGGVI